MSKMSEHVRDNDLGADINQESPDDEGRALALFYEAFKGMGYNGSFEDLEKDWNVIVVFADICYNKRKGIKAIYK